MPKASLRAAAHDVSEADRAACARERLRGRGRLAAAALLAGAVLAAPLSARAFCRTSSCGDVTGTRCIPEQPDDCGVPLYWPTKCLRLVIAQAGSTQVSADDAAAIEAQAMAAWTTADCGGEPPSIAVEVGPLVACGVHEFNEDGGNASILLFRDDEWPYSGAGDTLGLTTVTYDVPTGKIVDADIEINTHDAIFTTGDVDVKTDLLSVLTHETGHFLGLSHSKVADATMEATYLEGDIGPRTLADDDAAAICAAYPPDDPRERPCDETPVGGFSETCGGGIFAPGGCSCSVPGEGPSRGALAALLASIALAVGRRRRVA